MNNQPEQQSSIISNPNWAAFVMLVTLLSVLNSILSLLILPEAAIMVLGLVNIGISLILWVDFFYMLRKVTNRHDFWVRDYGWLALLGTFPFLRALKIFWFWFVLKREDKRPRDLLSEITLNRDAQGTLLGMLFIVLVVFQFSVVSILYFEAPAPDGNIHTVLDAFWWAFVTVSTVGYGDKFPVTSGGRLVGFSLILVGIALFSVITGTLTQWFLGQRKGRRSALTFSENMFVQQQEGITEIRRLLEQQAQTYQQGIDELNERIAELETSLKERI
jgi:voltage-gated potassium channel